MILQREFGGQRYGPVRADQFADQFKIQPRHASPAE
jgi:hypothetical protein